MALPTQTSALRLLIVAAALLGALVVTHLGLQASQNFARGCSGLAGAPVTLDPTAPAETSGCAEVTSTEYAYVLGVSNIAWGTLFYVLLIGLRLAYVATANDTVRLASFGVSTVGLLYAAYLVYLLFGVIGTVCALCLTSHVITLVLFGLHVMEHRRLATPAADPRRAPAPRSGLAALRPYVPLVAVFAVLVIADVALARRSTAEASPAASLGLNGTPPAAPINGAALAGTATDPAAVCTFDPNIAPIADLSPFTSGPFEGSADDDAVTVVEIFDPNCPHCRDLAEVLEPLKAELADQARFYTVAYPLREQSVAQVIALNLAQREGKYQQLVEEMFRRQDNTWGMSLPELVTTLNAVGMDGAAFQAQIEDNAKLQPLLTEVQNNATAVGDAFKSRDGGISTPRVAIGNRVILGTPQAYTPDCFKELIAQARDGAAAPQAVGGQ